MEVKDYLEKKEKGLAELIKVANGYAYAVKRFSQDTGEPEEPQIVPVSIDALNERKKELQNEIADIDAVLSDIAALG